MDGNAKVFQIVGYQNSGKTTLIEDIIQFWHKQGLSVGTIKHHGHGGTPFSNIVEKDTDRHLKSGVSVTAVEGEGELYFQNADKKWSLQEIVQLYKVFPLDLILVEGYKQEHYPKVVIIRKDEDRSLLAQLNNIQAVLTWIPLRSTEAYPIFSINKKQLFIHWLYKRFMKELEIQKE